MKGCLRPCLAIVATSILALASNAQEVAPASDPSPTGPVPTFNPQLADKHPRLLFSKEDLPAMRAFYRSSEGRMWREKLEEYARASKPFDPRNPAFQKDATDGQRQGVWRMPTAAMHFLMTGDNNSKKNAIGFLEALMKVSPWEATGEVNSGMSSANILTGAALVYDWMYDELDPDFREKVRERIWQVARDQYYGGHLNRNKIKNVYWQNDPQNNHRWHRNSGMTLGILAAYTGKADQRFMLQAVHDELEFIHKWLPKDGTSHEGPSYLVFGGNYLTLAFDASDRLLGTDFLDHPFFDWVPVFRIMAMTAGLETPLPFGDNPVTGLGSYGNFILKAAVHNRHATTVAMVRKLFEKRPDLPLYGWFSLIWDDPEVGAESADGFPTIGYFPDAGSTFFHDEWKEDGVSALFRCGPLGGFELNKFREESGKYINVAHDDPDANSFIIAIGPDLVALTSGYSHNKRSSNHNTILVNGVGQHPPGRSEGMVYSQPGGDDMREFAYTTGWYAEGDVVGIEGEAAKAYAPNRSRPQIDRFRRSFFWVEGDYILVLDDIQSGKDVEVTWLLQAEKIDGADDSWTLETGDARMPVKLLADKPFTARIGQSTADHRKKVLGFRQIQAKTGEVGDVRFVSAYDPWNRRVDVKIDVRNDKQAIVTVSGAGFEDQWAWELAPGDNQPSPIQARRVSGPDKKGFPLDFSRATNPDYYGTPVFHN